MPPPFAASDASSHMVARVRVSCRLRPALPTESTRCCTEITSVGGYRALQLKDPRGGKGATVYKFDGLYTAASTQEDIFETEVGPMIQRAMKGFHGTVFAYGVTGSGKTHTMIGTPQQEGILIRLWEDTNVDGSDPSLEVTFFEIYNNHCYDLFDSKHSEVQIRDDGVNPANMPDLTKVRIKSVEDFRRAFDSAHASRCTASTALNDRSSRSHAVLTLHLRYTEDSKTFAGKLNLIDLAGQEDNRKSGNAGARMAESGGINQSLFCLGNVLNAINSAAPRVPYRDSKLTRVLQDSLGGGSYAAMLICVAPHPKFYHDTLSTLNYACRARGVTNAPVDDVRPAPTAAAAVTATACGGGGGARAGFGGGFLMHAGEAGPDAGGGGPAQREAAGRKRKGDGEQSGAGGDKRGRTADAGLGMGAGVVKMEGGGAGAGWGPSAEDLVGGRQSELVCEFLRESEAMQLDALHHRIEEADSVLQERFFTPRRGLGLGAGACPPSPWAPMTPLGEFLQDEGGAGGCGDRVGLDRLLGTPRMRTPLMPRNPNGSEQRGGGGGGGGGGIWGGVVCTPGGAMGKGLAMVRRAAALEAEGRVEEALAVLQEVLDALPDHPQRGAVAAKVQRKLEELGGACEMLASVGPLPSPHRGDGDDDEGEGEGGGFLAELHMHTPQRGILSPPRPASAAPLPPQPDGGSASATSEQGASANRPAVATTGGGAGPVWRPPMPPGMGMGPGGAYGRMGPPMMFGVGPCGMANAVLHRQLVDTLNTAPYARLCHLKGIGKQRAKKLVELRGAPEMGLGPPMSHLDELKTIGMTSKQIDKFFVDNAPQMLFHHHR